ncbi:hypothetical protein NDU88_001968 [Pleurodeles waltl]|uniref:Uncharacterized protein n=1 Tax=Pleurodeles waltl TaxID=8319 RepID=A0AAV7W2M3_PLEWA|nr:hypothetical protein NDU88_001968 [Pleurodeles waltl]
MTGPDPSDTREDSDSCSESDGSQFAADCTCDPRSEPFAFLAPAPFRRTKESGRTGKGPSDPPRLSQAVVAKGRLSLEPQERSRRYRPLSSPIRFSLRARDAALRMPRVPYLVSAAILDLSVRRYESPKVSPSAPFVL